MTATHWWRGPACLALALISSACGHKHQASAKAFCDSITGGNSEVTTTGSVTDAPAAADGDLDTFADLHIGGTSPSASVRATAQPGIVFSAGEPAGGFVTFRPEGTFANIEITTYLDGARQESSGASGENLHQNFDVNTKADEFAWFPTTKPFDAVEIALSDSTITGTPKARIFEICSNGSTP